jgi:hypothetical protein
MKGLRAVGRNVIPEFMVKFPLTAIIAGRVSAVPVKYVLSAKDETVVLPSIIL